MLFQWFFCASLLLMFSILATWPPLRNQVSLCSSINRFAWRSIQEHHITSGHSHAPLSHNNMCNIHAAATNCCCILERGLLRQWPCFSQSQQSGLSRLSSDQKSPGSTNGRNWLFRLAACTLCWTTTFNDIYNGIFCEWLIKQKLHIQMQVQPDSSLRATNNHEGSDGLEHFYGSIQIHQDLAHLYAYHVSHSVRSGTLCFKLTCMNVW